jgi:hypothetical protein
MPGRHCSAGLSFTGLEHLQRRGIGSSFRGRPCRTRADLGHGLDHAVADLQQLGARCADSPGKAEGM